MMTMMMTMMMLSVIIIPFGAVPVAPPEIHLQAPKRVILTRGQSLTLACNTSNANGDIKLKWITPLGSVRSRSAELARPVGADVGFLLVECFWHWHPLSGRVPRKSPFNTATDGDNLA